MNPIIIPCDKKQCMKLYTSNDKWFISLVSALLFLLIASPFMYKLTDRLFSLVGLNIADSTGCPTMLGLGIHALVFLLIVRLLMK